MVHINSLTQPEYRSRRITVPNCSTPSGTYTSMTWDHRATLDLNGPQVVTDPRTMLANDGGLLIAPFTPEGQGRTAPIAGRCHDS